MIIADEQVSPSRNRDVLLDVRDLRVSFLGQDKQWLETVKGVSFAIAANQTVALVGESGSGKSVSSLAVMGLLPKQTSRIDANSQISFAGKDLLHMPLAERRAFYGREIAMIFQEPMSSLNPVFTVGAQIAEVLRLHMGMNKKQARARTLALLQEVGIPEPETKINAYPSMLSGGQQQRVMIAMAIACEPKLLIADEPTTALDVTIQKQIIELIQALSRKHQMAVLFITHDLALVGEIADQVIVMRAGTIREQGEVRQVLEGPVDAYTKALLYCRPPLDHRPRRLPVISDFIDNEGAVIVRKATAPVADRIRGLTGDESIILDVRNLSKSFYTRQGLFGQKEFKAVQDVSFTLAKGKTLGVVGESGSGKSTLGLMLMRLHQATSGQVLFEGRDLISMPAQTFRDYKRRIQIVFQNPYASLNPRFTVGQILIEPMAIHDIGYVERDRTKLAIKFLDRVGMPASSIHRYPHEFSGGQRQRIAIARCLTMYPDVLICDESVSALDVSVQAQVLNLLQDLQDEFGMSYIFISHDLSVVRYIADQVLVMNKGQVVEMADSDALFQRPQHAYTQRLLSAIPRGLKA